MPNEQSQQSRIRFYNITFDIDSAKLCSESYPQLDEIGRALMSSTLQRHTIYIEGHTDNVGPDEYNEQLARHRAEAVRRYVQTYFDLRDIQLHIRAYGKRRPLADNNTSTGRQQNRRVEIMAIKTE